MNKVQLNALNEAKKSLWAAKEPLKELQNELLRKIAANDLTINFIKLGIAIDTANSALSSLGERLRQIKKEEEARS